MRHAYIKIVGVSFFSAFVATIALLTSSVMADRITSPSYEINGNLGGSFGGDTSSTSYKMTTIGGETVIGNGQSGSYIIDQVQTNSSTGTMQLSIQPNGLVAYYPLDENTGTGTYDGSALQNNGVLSGTAAWSATGKLGTAVNINGSTDSTGTGAVLVPDSAALPSGSAMSFEGWVKQDAWYPNQAIASHWQYATSGSWAIQTGSDHNLRVYIAGTQTDTGVNYVETTVNTWNSFASWHHVAVSYDGTLSQANKVKIYVDGVLANSTVTGTLSSSLQNSSGSLSLGSFPGLGRALTGSLDHIKLFNRTLTMAEVIAEYNAQNTGIPSGFTLGALSGSSVTSLGDAIVRTNATNYSISAQQDHDLQAGSNTIPAIGGSITTPLTWSEGTTKGLGFTVTSAPIIDSKWGSGSKYAAFPLTTTAFYNGTGHVDGTVDTISMQTRLDVQSAQASGAYSNSVLYTGTTLP